MKSTVGILFMDVKLILTFQELLQANDLSRFKMESEN